MKAFWRKFFAILLALMPVASETLYRVYNREPILDGLSGLPPTFADPLSNVTVPIGREVTLTCPVENLGSYKVSWIRTDTQTILTVHTHVITRNPRITLNYAMMKTWYLHIKDVKEEDRGWYMCQINTDPATSQAAYLEVVVPPTIVDERTSQNIVVREGSEVILQCAAKGHPQPNITWVREDERFIYYNYMEIKQIKEETLKLPNVSRSHFGAYLCIAANGVPPSVSKRITLEVEFPPSIESSSSNGIIGAYATQHLTFTCLIEAYPQPEVYWLSSTGQRLSEIGGRFSEDVHYDEYRTYVNATIRGVRKEDFGEYICSGANALGAVKEVFVLSEIPMPSTTVKPSAKPLMVKEEASRSRSDKMDDRIVRAHQSSSGIDVHPAFCSIVILAVASLVFRKWQ